MSPRFDVPTHALAALFWSAIGVSTLTAAYAALSARDLVYDGSFYLLAIAKDRNFHIFEPARLSVQVLQQIPAVFGARLGIDNLWTLGRLFSLGMSGWPVVLTALCWLALPRGEKSWIAGPFVNIIFAIPAASFIGISEGIIASCLVWLAVLLVMFRLAQPFGALMALVASTACAVAHEATYSDRPRRLQRDRKRPVLPRHADLEVRPDRLRRRRAEDQCASSKGVWPGPRR